MGKDKDIMFKNVIAYKFDNNALEIPVCVRVGYRMEEDDWIVSSFGV